MIHAAIGHLHVHIKHIMKLFGLVLLACLAVSCSRKMNTKAPNSQTSDNKNVRSRLMLDGRVWMAENLTIDIPESYCQQDDTFNCNRYGRLYTWEAAKKGCDGLGDRWRLPTDEEWRIMAKHYGGVYDDSDDKGQSAYVNLLEGGNAEFNALLGGNREADGHYQRLGAHGFYWTATEYDSADAWFYNFGKGSTLLNHHSGSKKRAVSVRCVMEN